MAGDSSWLGPGTVLERRSPALMEAGADGRRSLRCSKRWFREGGNWRAVATQDHVNRRPFGGGTCERGIWNLKERLVWLSRNSPLPLSPRNQMPAAFTLMEPI